MQQCGTDGELSLFVESSESTRLIARRQKRLQPGKPGSQKPTEHADHKIRRKKGTQMS